MIVLDTNVVSELMKHSPASRVIEWIDQQDASAIVVTAITIAEISYGIHALPSGKRRTYLEDAFVKTIAEGFAHRVLPFDEVAAQLYGSLMAKRKQLGRPMSVPDGQIAGIAQSYTATLATRNTEDFVDCEIDLVDPFL